MCIISTSVNHSFNTVALLKRSFTLWIW